MQSMIQPITHWEEIPRDPPARSYRETEALLREMKTLFRDSRIPTRASCTRSSRTWSTPGAIGDARSSQAATLQHSSWASETTTPGWLFGWGQGTPSASPIVHPSFSASKATRCPRGRSGFTSR